MEAVIESDINDNWDQFLPVFITGDITRSVGRNGTNDAVDVRTVQRLLNPFIAARRLTIQTQLVVDGQIGPATIDAIENFQRIFVGMSRPDGRVDPGGDTLKKLNGSITQPTATSGPVPSSSGSANCGVSGDRARCGTCEARERRVHGASPPTLVTIPSALHSRGGSEERLHEEAANAYRRMVEAARQDGIAAPYLLLMSGYRNYDHQARLWRRRLLAKFTSAGCGGQGDCIGQAIDATTRALRNRPQPHQNNEWRDRFLRELRNRGNCGHSCDPGALVKELRKGTAPPGRSPHHTGRAIDIFVGNASGYSPVSKAQANVRVQRRTNAFRWLVCNAARFGFHPLRNEPWHWEYNP